MGKMISVLIGCGTIARRHLAALAVLENVEVAAVCDLSAARAAATAERYAIEKWYCDYKELLTHIRPDLVHITTPPASHFSIAKDFLTASVNVLCEKPITVNYQDFVALKCLAIEKGCLLMENQNLRFHSSIARICNLVDSGEIGDVLSVHIWLSVDLFAPGSVFADSNVPHFSHALRGGAIGDFLPHIAYLVYMFTGPVTHVRTIWKKHNEDSSLPADEFQALINGERATAHAGFSGNGQPSGFWVRVVGTRMHVETNLYEPSRLVVRRLRSGQPAFDKFVDGLAESRDVAWGTVSSFWEKLGGASGDYGIYDLIALTYRSLERREPQPVPLEEIDEVTRLVELFTRSDLKL